MRHHFLWLGLLCIAAALPGCGNADDGRPFTPNGKPFSAAQQQALSSNTINTARVTKLLFCSNPLFVSSDPGINTMFAGSVLCPTEGVLPGSRGYSIRLKVNANIPVNTQLCLVPFVGNYPDAERCFAFNGQIDVLLATNQYTSAVVLNESDLSAYKAYLSNPALFPPPRVLYSL